MSAEMKAEIEKENERHKNIVQQITDNRDRTLTSSNENIERIKKEYSITDDELLSISECNSKVYEIDDKSAEIHKEMYKYETHQNYTDEYKKLSAEYQRLSVERVKYLQIRQIAYNNRDIVSAGKTYTERMAQEERYHIQNISYIYAKY